MKRATSKPLTEEQKADLAALETLADAQIDTSDIPEAGIDSLDDLALPFSVI